MNRCSFRILRAVTVWRSGQHALDQTSEASYLFLHCLHSLQTMISAEEVASEYKSYTWQNKHTRKSLWDLLSRIMTSWNSPNTLKLTCCCRRLAQTSKSQRQMRPCQPPQGQLSETEVLNPSRASTLGSLQTQKRMWSLCGRFAWQERPCSVNWNRSPCPSCASRWSSVETREACESPCQVWLRSRCRSTENLRACTGSPPGPPGEQLLSRCWANARNHAGTDQRTRESWRGLRWWLTTVWRRCWAGHRASSCRDLHTGPRSSSVPGFWRRPPHRAWRPAAPE